MSKAMKFNVISDIHLDYWVKMHTNLNKMQLKIDTFVEGILPTEITNTLVIAGDLGHYNLQNFMLLKLLKKYFKNILIVYGNHDYYMATNKIEHKYKGRSGNRIAEMTDYIDQLENVCLLDGITKTIDDVTYGGCTMWYDLSYGLNVLKKDLKEILYHWRLDFNDSKLINYADINNIFDMYNNEKEKLESIIDESDVIITHVSPDYDTLPDKYKEDIYSSFYLFNGKPYFDKLKDKVWCFGHIHTPMYYCHSHCHFINASFGYPPDKGPKITTNKIQTVDI